MDLFPDDDQLALQNATNDWCRQHMPLETARNRSADLWPRLTAMGWVGMTGAAMQLDHATEALVFAELGRFLAPVALLSTAVAGHESRADDKIALALLSGETLRVLDGEQAGRVLGIFPDGLKLSDLPDTEFAPSLDLTTPMACVDVPASATLIDDPQASRHLQLLLTAYAIGCADAARDMATGYARMREQFDRPIGWFQAIKHLCADMAVRCEVARSQLYFAACALDDDASDMDFHIAAARRLADQAALENSRGNIQIHGGIGMTDEALPHLCLKRAHLLQFLLPADHQILLGA